MFPWIQLSPDTAQALARTHGTPFYVYDLDVLLARVCVAREALPAALLYAVKANPNPQLLAALLGEVAGLDVASGGELDLALRCGWPGTALSFAGPGKTRDDLEAAVTHGVVLSVESLRELDDVAAIAARQGVRARVRLRVNPRTRAKAYRVTMTGGASPFGVDEEELDAAVTRLRSLETAIDFDGLHIHHGAQCTSVGGFAAAVQISLDLAHRLRTTHDLRVRRLNLGGGLGVVAPGEELDVVSVGKRLTQTLAKFRRPAESFDLVVEPGRWLVGPAGLYVARVVSEKVSRSVHFVMLDGGMNHHLGATGHLSPLDAPRAQWLNLTRPDAPLVARTIVGPLCTPLDRLATDLLLPEPRPGDLLGVIASGAYGYSFSPLHFLGHPLPPEVLLNQAR